MTDGIIFDLDGTLWDSTAVVARAWSQAVAQATGTDPHYTADSIRPYFGRLLPEIAALLFPQASPAEQLTLMDLCTQQEHEALLQTPGRLYPDLAETLAQLSADYPLFIVSNCQAGYIEDFLATTGLGRYFIDHLCPGDSGEAKAENILAIAAKHHLQAPVYVGDTAGDHTATKKAGLRFIHAAYGFGTVETPDLRIQSISELPARLAELPR